MFPPVISRGSSLCVFSEIITLNGYYTFTLIDLLILLGTVTEVYLSDFHLKVAQEFNNVIAPENLNKIFFQEFVQGFPKEFFFSGTPPVISSEISPLISSGFSIGYALKNSANNFLKDFYRNLTRHIFINAFSNSLMNNY